MKFQLTVKQLLGGKVNFWVRKLCFSKTGSLVPQENSLLFHPGTSVWVGMGGRESSYGNHGVLKNLNSQVKLNLLIPSYFHPSLLKTE